MSGIEQAGIAMLIIVSLAGSVLLGGKALIVFGPQLVQQLKENHCD